MNQAEKEPSSTMLYVSNLPFSFEDKDLHNVFQGYEVASAYVAVRHNGRSKGFGFVTFKTTDQQKKALAAFDGKELDGRTLTVKVAHKDDRRDAKGELREEFKNAEPRAPRRQEASEKVPSETVVYVSNLPFDFTDEQLSGVFAAHKPVSARIARRRNGGSKGFGFVEFADKGTQTAALALDEHSIGDRSISVKVSLVGANAGSHDGDASAGDKKKKAAAPKREKKATGEAGEKAPSAPSTNTLYISNLPFDLTDEMLADLFKSKGHNPVSARIARRRDERSKGFGFVELENQEKQAAALKAVDGTTLGDRVISAKVALKDSEPREPGAAPKGRNNDNNAAAPREAGAKRKRIRKKGGDDDKASSAERPKRPERKEKKDSDRLVYVSNLSFDVDDAALAKLFDGIHIKSAHVAVRHNGKSKGFGFVECASREDQQKAIAKNGVELAGRTLVVEVAKEEVAEGK